jgi:hypothetical protein
LKLTEARFCASGDAAGDNFRPLDVWYLGVIFAASMTDLIQALVYAFWQSHQKIHAEEFLLEQLERIVKGSEEPTQQVIDEFEMNDPCPCSKERFFIGEIHEKLFQRPLAT